MGELGVVFVSMNYRMGRLGFFAHPALLAETPDEVHGNYGYMDQRSALQWVQRNIAAFGGNPKAVTIFGQSSGGGSVVAHLTSPLSRGLFQRAIMLSPGFPAPRAKAGPLTELRCRTMAAIMRAHSGSRETARQPWPRCARCRRRSWLRAQTTRPKKQRLRQASLSSAWLDRCSTASLSLRRRNIVLAAGREAKVAVMIGATDRDHAQGSADSKDELFAIFGADAVQARKLYDPQGDQTLDELKQQVFCDKIHIEPARYLADAVARAGRPAYLYRFSYVR